MRGIKEYILLFFKGVGMGTADVIPGVSGGTIAFITGIYEELINSIKSVDGQALRLLFSGNIKSFWAKINGTFLVVLLSGILISLFSLANVIIFFMANYPVQLWSFFFGLILISSFIVLREVHKWSIGVIMAGIVGIVIAYIITLATPAETPNDLWFIFLSGCIAICAMILPGISGSFILLILAKYEYIIEALTSFNLPVIIVFALGCVVGITSFSRLISWVFKHFHNITVALLAGFMLGSLNKVWPWKITTGYRIDSHGEQVPVFTESVSPGTFFEVTGENPQLIEAVLYAAFGVLLVVGLEKLADYFKNRA